MIVVAVSVFLNSLALQVSSVSLVQGWECLSGKAEDVDSSGFSKMQIQKEEI